MAKTVNLLKSHFRQNFSRYEPFPYELRGNPGSQ